MIPLAQVKKVIETHNYKRVLFHLPAGLMKYWEDLASLVAEPLFASDPCFGACDVPFESLDKFRADAVFSFGHSKPIALEVPQNIHFFEVKLSFDAEFVPSFERVGLVYVIQYRDSAKIYAEKLRKLGKTVIMGGRPGFLATYDGQVTGCDVGAALSIKDKVDGFVVCSDGHFHSQAVSELGKPTFNWLGEVANAPKYPVALLSLAKTVGILVSSKIGQFDMKGAEKIKKDLENRGKKVLMVVGDKITNEIDNFKIDFWVVTACPRIAQDRPKSAPLGPAKAYIKGVYK